MNTESPPPESDRRIRLPRWAVPPVWLVIVVVIQILAPWAVSNLGSRIGWSQSTPSVWNYSGLLLAAVGLGLYSWCLVFHFKSYRSAVRVGFSPPHLVTSGPYQVSRNPMYVAGLLAWAGWTVFYGSLAVLAALALLWLAFALRVIPYEERQLEMLFGEDYLEYKRTVPRWIGRL